MGWGLVLLGVALLDAPLCPVAGLFGIPCPGCGMSRAAVALLRGQIALAWQFHPLVFLVAPLLAGLIGASLARGLRRNSREATRSGESKSALIATAAAGLLVLALSLWIARFLGAFGGPVDVETYAEWLDRARSSVTP